MATPPVAPGRPKFPKHLSREARTIFKKLCADLESRKTLTPGDRETIGLFAVIYDRHQRALADIAARGEIVEFDSVLKDGITKVKRTKKNEYLDIAVGCEKNLFAILQSLGLTPVSRSKVKVPAVPKDNRTDEEKTFESLMHRTRLVPSVGDKNAN